jgi:hypothetical protein
MPAEHEHPAVDQVRLLALELAETRRCLEYVMARFQQLVADVSTSPDQRTRELAAGHRVCALRRLQQGPEWAWGLAVAVPLTGGKSNPP